MSPQGWRSGGVNPGKFLKDHVAITIKKPLCCQHWKKCDASMSQSDNFGIGHTRFKPSMLGANYACTKITMKNNEKLWHILAIIAKFTVNLWISLQSYCVF